MPAVKQPCAQCKGDEERPKCRRCQIKELPCSRPVKRTVFKHGSVGSFSRDQKWVNSEARHFRFHARGGSAGREPTSSDRTSPTPMTMLDSEEATGHSHLIDDGHKSPPAASSKLSPMDMDPRPDSFTSPDRFTSARDSDQHQSRAPASSQPSFLPPISQLSPSLYRKGDEPMGTMLSPGLTEQSPNPSYNTLHAPLEHVQEACLFRYYIEEISHWFDLCDENRHFHLVVPVKAREYPHLLNAIFAVSARHLSRLPQYKTPQGILYHNQLLPKLDKHSAVEYMLQCIPALRQFHDVRDDDHRDSIIATAVILRQLEEIDNEEDETQGSGLSSGALYGSESSKQVNFLAIIDAVLRSPPSQSVFGRRSLMQAAYWMALRQEVFHSFTRWEAPKLILPPEFWHSASNANKTVMHLVRVARWKWGDNSAHEWMRLMEQQDYLERSALSEIQPIYNKPADKAKGEIFPTVWYRSNIEVTSMQLSLLARSVLVAENPNLKLPSASRSDVRQVENEVRQLLLEQCGIGLCNPASPPALVHAAFGIQLYGDFFTDQYERKALRTVVERYRDTHAWPVQRLLDMFR